MQQKKIFIIGSNGFIGNNFSNFMYEHKNVLLFNRENIQYLTQSNKICEARYSFENAVILFAAENNRFINNKIHKESNYLLEKLLKLSHGNLIYLSSNNVYGSSFDKIFNEKDEPNPLSKYSSLKLENENKVLIAGGTVLRLSNVIGNGMSSRTVISEIINSLKFSKSIKVRNFNDKRDYIYINDLCQILKKIIFRRKKGIFNVGSGEAFTVLELIKIILKISNLEKINYEQKNLNQKDTCIIMDISKLKDIYNIKCFTKIEKALKKILSEIK